MSSLIKNIIAVVLLVGLAAAGYYLYVLNQGATIETSSDTTLNTALETQTILRRLSDLQSIQIPTEVLQDAKFQSLFDFSSPIDRVQVGREDPFRKPTI